MLEFRIRGLTISSPFNHSWSSSLLSPPGSNTKSSAWLLEPFLLFHSFHTLLLSIYSTIQGHWHGTLLILASWLPPIISQCPTFCKKLFSILLHLRVFPNISFCYVVVCNSGTESRKKWIQNPTPDSQLHVTLDKSQPLWTSGKSLQLRYRKFVNN